MAARSRRVKTVTTTRPIRGKHAGKGKSKSSIRKSNRRKPQAEVKVVKTVTPVSKSVHPNKSRKLSADEALEKAIVGAFMHACKYPFNLKPPSIGGTHAQSCIRSLHYSFDLPTFVNDGGNNNTLMCCISPRVYDGISVFYTFTSVSDMTPMASQQRTFPWPQAPTVFGAQTNDMNAVGMRPLIRAIRMKVKYPRDKVAGKIFAGVLPQGLGSYQTNYNMTANDWAGYGVMTQNQRTNTFAESVVCLTGGDTDHQTKLSQYYYAAGGLDRGTYGYPAVMAKEWPQGSIFSVECIYHAEIAYRGNEAEVYGATMVPHVNDETVAAHIPASHINFTNRAVKVLKDTQSTFDGIKSIWGDYVKPFLGAVTSALPMLPLILAEVDLPTNEGKDWDDYRKFSDGTLPSIGDTYMKRWIIKDFTHFKSPLEYYLQLTCLEAETKEQAIFTWHFPRDNSVKFVTASLEEKSSFVDIRGQHIPGGRLVNKPYFKA